MIAHDSLADEDRFYYQVGPRRFTDKIQAILHAEETGQFPHFCCHDDIYSVYDWSQEPSEDLDVLYTRRAQELRQQYDYLVLHFSGGSDSANILETFIRNRIPLDEILIRMPLESVDLNINNTAAENTAAEVYFTALPLANLVKSQYYPNLKITVKDSGDYVKNYFRTLDLKSDTSTITSISNLSPTSIQNADIDNLHKDLQGIAERGRRIGHIYGTDKCPIYWNGTEYRVRFLDKTASLFFNNYRRTSIDLPSYKEAFYWAPSTAPIIIKQAHMIRKHIKAMGLDLGILEKLNGRARHNFLASIIYRRTLPLPFSPEKSRAIGITSQDAYFFRDPNAEHVQNWRRIIDGLDQVIPVAWKHAGSMYNDLVGIYSREYSIGA